jgi:hypothetical protein
MPDRHSDQERWEVYILQIILATRPFIFSGGIILFLLAGMTMFRYPISSGVSFCLSLTMIGLVFSDRFCQLVAKFGAWFAAFGNGSDY